MREVSFDITVEEKALVNDSTLVSDNWTQQISPDFVPKDSYHVSKRSEQFISVSYNSRKNMFVLIDSNGVTTWEWKKYTNKIVRAIKYDIKDAKNILDCIYSRKHNCYFALQANNSIAVLNRDFDEVHRAITNTTILCMIYNPVNDELLTSSMNGIKIWQLEPNIPNKSDSTKPLGNHQLNLKKELNVTQDWIKKIDIDPLNCHLYCCTANDLFIYDFNGNLMRHYEEVHKLAVTCCVYSPTAKVVITGSADCDIKIWSLAGGLLETFRAHSLPISSLILNPHNSNLILSASLDGTIKMWSLDIMQQIYQLNLFKSEILWMGITEENLLYVASPFDVTMWSITNFIDFWAIARDRIRSIDFDYSRGRSCRMIIVSEENAIRIFHRDQVCQLTAVMPIPKLNSKLQMTSIVYSRYYEIIYILLSNNEMWLYYTKTNPCTHLVVLDTVSLLESEIFDEPSMGSNENEGQKKKSNNLVIHEVVKQHRAIEYGLDYLDKNDRATTRCICILDSEVIYWNVDGPNKPPQQIFLLLGLDNGNIVFCDALNQTKKYLSLNCSKDPIVEMVHDKPNDTLMVRVELVSLYHIQYYKLPELELQHEIFCSKTMTSYARLNSSVLLGFEDGSIDLVEIKGVTTKESFNRAPSESETMEILNKNLKYEHKQKVEIIDTCKRLELFLTCSLDGCIKIWNANKKLVIEIKLDATLSHCRFFNSMGDLICGYRNHLFKIVLKRILPEYSNIQDDYYDEFDDIYIDDSIVIEDPGLQNDDQATKIDLNKYLHPFDVKCDKNGVLRVHQPEKKLKNITLLQKRHSLEVKSMESFMSSLPGSFFETPRDNPLADLKMVDLTLGSHVNQLDLRAYLVDWLSESLMKSKIDQKSFPRDWRFPLFGSSPNSTPSCTPTPSLGEKDIPQVDDFEEDSVSKKFTEEERSKIQKVFTEKMTSIHDKESLKSIEKEEEPKKDIYRAIIDIAPKSKNLNMGKRIVRNQEIQIKHSLPVKIFDEPEEKVQIKPKHTPKTYSLLETTELKSSLMNRSSTLDLKSSTFRSSSNVVPRTKRSSIRNTSGRTQFISAPSQQKAQKSSSSLQRSVNSAGTNNSRISPSKKQSLKTASIITSSSSILPNETLLKESSRMTHETLSKPPLGHPTKSSSKILRKKTPRYTNNQDEQIFQEDQFKILQIQQNSSRMSMNSDLSLSNFRRMSNSSVYDKENQGRVSKSPNFNALAQRSFLRSRQSTNESKLEKQFELSGMEKTQFLFEYLYGMKGTPLRNGSGSYILPHRNLHSPSPVNMKTCTEITNKNPDVIIDDYLTEEEKHFIEYATTSSLSNSVFGDWLSEYERKKSRLSHRMNRAKENNEYLTSESHRIMTEAIARKHSAANSRIGSCNREVLSFLTPQPTQVDEGARRDKTLKAVISNLDRSFENQHANSEASFMVKSRDQKRSKSVSFHFDKSGNPSQYTSHKKDPLTEKPHTAPKPIIRLQPAYLVSQIEMEEILSEAMKKLEESKEATTTSNVEEEPRKRTHSQISLHDSSKKNINNNVVIQQDNENSSDLDLSDNEFDLFSKADSSFKKTCSIRSALSAMNRPKSSNPQVYQPPSKLDNWNTEHRLSMKSAGSQKSQISMTPGGNMSKIIDFTDSEEEEEFALQNEQALKFTRFQLDRPRTANSIPNKNGKYVFIKAPQLNLEYQLPNSPEKYLLPIRFPKLYSKILRGIQLYNKKLEQELEEKKQKEFLTGMEIF